MQFRIKRPFWIQASTYLLLTWGALLLAPLASAQRYTFTDLGTLGGSLTSPTSINSAGVVVGYSETVDGFQHAFIWQCTTGIIDLGTLGGDNSIAWDINTSGWIVGSADLTGNTETHAFLKKPGLAMTDLGVLKTGAISEALAINDAGTIVGDSETGVFDGVNYIVHPFLWKAGPGMKDLGSFGGPLSYAIDINAAEHVVGTSDTAGGFSHAFYWDVLGGLKDLGTLGGDSSKALGINSSDVVIGDAQTADPFDHSFRWTKALGLQDIGTLAGGTSYTGGISTSGLIVGSSTIADGSTHATLWTSTGPVDLNTRIEAGYGMILSDAFALNDNGWIVGEAYDSDLIRHAFVLTPTPTVTLSGKITLEECLHPAQTITFTFRPKDCSATFTRQVPLSANGSFTLTEVPSLNYKLAIKGHKWLQKVIDLDASKGNVTGISSFLVTGDINNDNVVGLDDLGALSLAFDTKPGDADYDSNADLNCDDKVDLDDLGLLSLHFDEAGDP